MERSHRLHGIHTETRLHGTALFSPSCKAAIHQRTPPWSDAAGRGGCRSLLITYYYNIQLRLLRNKFVRSHIYMCGCFVRIHARIRTEKNVVSPRGGGGSLGGVSNLFPILPQYYSDQYRSCITALAPCAPLPRRRGGLPPPRAKGWVGASSTSLG